MLGLGWCSLFVIRPIGAFVEKVEQVCYLFDVGDSPRWRFVDFSACGSSHIDGNQKKEFLLRPINIKAY